MKPFERFKKLNTEGILWPYIISLASEKEVCDDEIRRLIFESFGFLPPGLLLKRVIFQLKRTGFLSKERYKGKSAFKATEEGKKKLKKLINFSKELLEKFEKS